MNETHALLSKGDLAMLSLTILGTFELGINNWARYQSDRLKMQYKILDSFSFEL